MDGFQIILNHFDMEISVCNDKRAEFLRSIKNDLVNVNIVSIYDLFNEQEIEMMKELTHKKECFKNAFMIASTFHPTRGIKYVEGRVLVGNCLPIEHAWNKIGDKYFDATFEIALGLDVTKEVYALLREYDVCKVREILLKRKYYGEIYWYEKFHECFSELKTTDLFT